MRPQDVVDATVVRQPKAYPVHDERYAENVAVIRREIASRIGRVRGADQRAPGAAPHERSSMSIAEIPVTERAALLATGHVRLVVDITRYGACSLAALALDSGLLLWLTGMGMQYLEAAAIGFASGLILAYLLSIAFVFKGRRTLSPMHEFLGFTLIGAGGLAVNQLLLAGLVGASGCASRSPRWRRRLASSCSISACGAPSYSGRARGPDLVGVATGRPRALTHQG